MRMSIGLALNRRRAGAGGLSAPTVGNGIEDQVFEVDVLLADPLDTTAAFVGSGLSFTLDGTSAALPTGLTFTDGVITGTPTVVADPVAIVVRATNSAGHVTTTFNLRIASRPTATGSISNVDRGHDAITPTEVVSAATVAAAFTGDRTGYAVSASAPGVSINAATGAITADPLTMDAVLVSVAAVNYGLQSPAVEFTLTQRPKRGFKARVKSPFGASQTVISPPGEPGDLLIIVTDHSGTAAVPVSSSGVDPVVQDDVNLRFFGDNFNLQVSYIKLTEATVGLTINPGGGRDAEQRRLTVYNAGKHTFHTAATTLLGVGSTDVTLTVFNDLPQNAKVAYFSGQRTNITVTWTNPPLDTAGTLDWVTVPEEGHNVGHNLENNGQTTFGLVTLDAPGSSPSARLDYTGTVQVRGGIAMAMIPDPTADEGVAYPGQYIADDNGAGLARSSDVTEFIVEEQTFTLAETTQVGNYIGPSRQGLIGEIWVRPISPATNVTISAYTPAYGVLANGNTGNGAVLNMAPILGGASGVQRFNTKVGTQNPTFSAPLSDATVPITLVPGDVLTVAQSETGTQTERKMIRNYAYIHCVSDIPYDDEFAPSPCWHPSLGARPRYRYSDVNEGLLPSLSTAGLSAPSASSLQALLFRRMPTYVATQGRYGLGTNISAFPASTNYGRDIQECTDNAFAFICGNADIAIKRPIVQALIQRGIDDYGSMRAAYAAGVGQWMEPDGGHNGGRMATVIIAGHLLGDTTMRDWIKDNTDFTTITGVQDAAMRGYLNPTVVAQTQEVGWVGAGGGPYEPYPTPMGEAPAVPEWLGNPGVNKFHINNVWEGAQYYRNVGNSELAAGQVTALLAMGLKTAVGNDAYFDYHARWHGMAFYKDDPWRYINGDPTARYDYMPTAPTGSPITPTRFADRMYNTHIFLSPTYYEFPAGVNDFNGAT